MNPTEFIKKHSDTWFSFHKIDSKYTIEYVNTTVGVVIKGTIKNNSMLDLTETGGSLVSEIIIYKIETFEPI